MTSIAQARSHGTAGLVRKPEFAFPARLRMAAAGTTAVVGRAITAARAYEGARGTSARRAALREFAATR
ncbi:hypothetical protein SAMN04515665_106149 [Blastococcus sp. DSM 46786]|uniref:hypothetical protein n=1 Tax=Blastococcus sp. DSM 46786 TaxID=1798227 RepID=UPI0008C713CC|nr:hypothetical protein [Blastococcus sp. DSM 46786]SEK92778.1 hypothetical protein SAMN04515665_106149 [Blastococcus sp. DSM 46786]